MVNPLAAKGQLQPEGPAVSVQRHEIGEAFSDLARQVWIPRWKLPDGVVVTQPVLQYPALNVAVEADAAAVHLPVGGVGTRDLAGAGWAAGLLLRPGAGSLIVPGDMSTMLGSVVPIPNGCWLIETLRELMGTHADPADIVTAYEHWLGGLLHLVDEEVRLVNAITDAAEHDVGIRTPRDLREQFSMSERAMQRLLKRRVGFSPRWLIQRRRLQEAALQIRERPDMALADIAADLGYADQAHFNRDFGAVIAMTPGDYRRSLP